jgi:Carboxypeptidase regulatory-like domain
MKTATIALCCILPMSISWSAAIAVNAGPIPPTLSSSHVQIFVMLDGKPLKSARVDFYKWNPDVSENKSTGPLCFSGLTNDNGVVSPPALAAGDYHVLAGDEDKVLWLRVIDERTTMTNLFTIDLTDSAEQARQIQDAVKRAEALPISDRVQALQGVVVDTSGAIIPNARIRITKNGTEGRAVILRSKADSIGHFSAQLSDGLYIAVFYSHGFRAEAVPFEVTKEGSGDLRVVLPIGKIDLPITRYQFEPQKQVTPLAS